MDSHELIEAQDRSRSGRRSEVEQALIDATVAKAITRARFVEKPATRTEYWEDYKVKVSEYEEAEDLFIDDYRQKIRRGEAR